MPLLLFSIILGCSNEADFNREEFEDQWWSVEEQELCFNVHNESGDFLLYKESISSPGAWFFLEPSTYGVSIENEAHYIYVDKYNDCWDIIYDNGIINYNVISCECNIYD